MKTTETQFNRQVRIANIQLSHKARNGKRAYTWNELFTWFYDMLEKSKSLEFDLVRESVMKITDAIVYIKARHHKSIK